jgi:flagellar hook assembly protein FlgD
MGAGLGVLALHKAVPNPFSSTLTIHWSVPKLQLVELKVFNTAGQVVNTLAQGAYKPGIYTTTWRGTDRKGRRLAAGVYFYTLETGDKRLSRKVVLAE